MFNELCPLTLRRKRHLRVSVPGKIDKIEIAINSVEVNRLRPSGRITGERQLSFPCKRIDQAGFSDVASPQESYLGQPVGGELLGTTGTVYEFR